MTDGSSFTDLQTRDMTYTVETTDDRALSCRVTAQAKSGRYRIVTDYVTDTARESVVMRSRFTALKGRRATTASTSASTRRSTATAAADPATAAPTAARSRPPAATRCSSAPTP